MNYYPFDSRNKIYKPHFGAIKAGETLLLRILLHNDAKVHDAFILITPDGENTYEQRLEPKEYLEDYRYYDIEIKFQTGLYFYSFRYTSDYGEFFVTKTETSLGIVSRDGGRWQQTVYDNDFCVPSFLDGGIIYQIFPDRFYASGKVHENIPNDRFLSEDWEKQPEYRQNNGICSLGNDYYGGDLEGITEKLPYLRELGVSVIYLNPICEAHSNHRYNTANYMKIDPMLGTDEDLKNLCKKAKEQGISVILDGVFSHTGDDSIYFNKYKRYGESGAFSDPDSPYRKWYTFRGEYPGYSAWWGVPSLPEIKEENEEFLEFITGKNGVVRHWLSLGVSGIRLDVADELPDLFLEKLRDCVKSFDKNAYILGEVWEDASNKISYGKRRKFLLGKQLDSVMNYPFANAIIDYVCLGSSENLRETVLSILENYPPESIKTLMNHIGTHDTARIITAIANYQKPCGDREWQSKQTLNFFEYNFAVLKLKIASLIQFTLPGVPSVYYGDEAGLTGFGDPFCRGTYPWKNENIDLVFYYKALGNMRRNRDVFVDGEFLPIIADNGLFVFLRQKNDKKILIATNVSEQEREFPNTENLNNLIFGENISENKEKIKLKPYGYAVVE